MPNPVTRLYVCGDGTAWARGSGIPSDENYLPIPLTNLIREAGITDVVMLATPGAELDVIIGQVEWALTKEGLGSVEAGSEFDAQPLVTGRNQLCAPCIKRDRGRATMLPASMAPRTWSS